MSIIHLRANTESSWVDEPELEQSVDIADTDGIGDDGRAILYNSIEEADLIRLADNFSDGTILALSGDRGFVDQSVNNYTINNEGGVTIDDGAFVFSFGTPLVVNNWIPYFGSFAVEMVLEAPSDFILTHTLIIDDRVVLIIDEHKVYFYSVLIDTYPTSLMTQQKHKFIYDNGKCRFYENDIFVKEIDIPPQEYLDGTQCTIFFGFIGKVYSFRIFDSDNIPE